MKGYRILPLFLFTLSGAFAATPTPSAVPTSAVSHVESEAESKQIASANASPAQPAAPTSPTLLGAGKGYFEVVGGLGIGRTVVGKSRLGVSSTETDWVSQSRQSWQAPYAHLGLGYIYALTDVDRASTGSLIMFPSVEALLNVSYANFEARGNVYLIKNSQINTQTFSMPLKTTSLMLDAILTLAKFKRLSLYVLGGAGEAWTNIKYTDTPSGNPGARPSLSTNSRTQSNGVYEWGTGVTYALTPRYILGLQYLYSHIGNIRTSGRGSLGGVTDTQISAANFSLRNQIVMLDLHVAIN